MRDEQTYRKSSDIQGSALGTSSERLEQGCRVHCNLLTVVVTDLVTIQTTMKLRQIMSNFRLCPCDFVLEGRHITIVRSAAKLSKCKCFGVFYG